MADTLVLLGMCRSCSRDTVHVQFTVVLLQYGLICIACNMPLMQQAIGRGTSFSLVWRIQASRRLTGNVQLLSCHSVIGMSVLPQLVLSWSRGLCGSVCNVCLPAWELLRLCLPPWLGTGLVRNTFYLFIEMRFQASRARPSKLGGHGQVVLGPRYGGFVVQLRF